MLLFFVLWRAVPECSNAFVSGIMPVPNYFNYSHIQSYHYLCHCLFLMGHFGVLGFLGLVNELKAGAFLLPGLVSSTPSVNSAGYDTLIKQSPVLAVNLFYPRNTLMSFPPKQRQPESSLSISNPVNNRQVKLGAHYLLQSRPVRCFLRA